MTLLGDVLAVIAVVMFAVAFVITAVWVLMAMQ
jgi:uncharacterized membrane protein (DUF485 family)